MKDLRDSLRQINATQVKEEKTSSTGSSLDISREELLGMLSLNTSEYLKPYDGDPLMYHVFTMAFDQTVDKIADSFTETYKG